MSHPQRMAEINDIIRKTTRKYHADLADIAAVFPYKRILMASDNHPNTKGHKIIFSKLIKVIR